MMGQGEPRAQICDAIVVDSGVGGLTMATMPASSRDRDKRRPPDHPAAPCTAGRRAGRPCLPRTGGGRPAAVPHGVIRTGNRYFHGLSPRAWAM